MPIKNADPNLGSGKFLSGDFDPNISSEHETLIANAGVYVDGTVMGKLTSGANIGRVVNFDPANVEGAAVAYGILFGDKLNKTTIQRVVVVVRDQVVNGNLITYRATATTPQRAAAELALKAVSLIVRR